MLWSLLRGEVPLSSSEASCPLASLPLPLLSWLPIEPIRPDPLPTFDLGARDCLLVVLLRGTVDLFPTPELPVKEVLVVLDAGAAGGPIDVFALVRLSLGLDIVIEGGLVDDGRAVEGVPPRGVDVVEVAAESCFVGDLVGDCIR